MDLNCIDGQKKYVEEIDFFYKKCSPRFKAINILYISNIVRKKRFVSNMIRQKKCQSNLKYQLKKTNNNSSRL